MKILGVCAGLNWLIIWPNGGFVWSCACQPVGFLERLDIS